MKTILFYCFIGKALETYDYILESQEFDEARLAQ